MWELERERERSVLDESDISRAIEVQGAKMKVAEQQGMWVYDWKFA